MKPQDLTPERGRQLGIRFGHEGPYGLNGEWYRVFVYQLRPEEKLDLSIGRYTFQNNRLYGRKFYSDKWYGSHLGLELHASMDRCINGIVWFDRTGKVLTDEAYRIIVEHAQQIVADDLAKKMAARQAAGSKKRPRLTGRDVRWVIRNIIEGREKDGQEEAVRG